MRLGSTRGLAGAESVGPAEKSGVSLHDALPFMAPNLHQIRCAQERMCRMERERPGPSHSPQKAFGLVLITKEKIDGENIFTF